MKLNLKNTLLASGLILLSLSACSSDNAKKDPFSNLKISEIPKTKTTGHTAQITQSLVKLLHMKKDATNKVKITFDENTYKAEDDSFDISNLKIDNTATHSVFNVYRMVKDSTKSVQMVIIQYTAEDNTYMTVTGLDVLGDLSQEKNIDINMSAKDLKIKTVRDAKHYVFNVASINFLSKITDKGVEKLNINTKGLDFESGLPTETEGIIQALKGNFAFYKTSPTLTDNNYTITSDVTIGYDAHDKSKTSNLKNTINLMLDNAMIKYTFGNVNMDKSSDDVTAMQNTTKFVSTILNFKNNGFMKFLSDKQPVYAKQISDPKAKDMVKTYYKGFLGKYNLLTDQELTSVVDVLFNVVLNDKDLNLTIKALKPDTFENLSKQIETQSDSGDKQKVISVQASN